MKLRDRAAAMTWLSGVCVGVVTTQGTHAQTSGSFVRVGTIMHPAIVESSGLAASRRYPGVIWTHNDSGSNPFIFAMRENGTSIRAFQVKGASLIDWEDIGTDNSGNLYLADIGSNGMQRTHVAVHRLREPNPYRVSAARVDKTWLLRFPDRRVDCEGFFVSKGFGYVVTKERANNRVSIYRFPLTAPGGRSVLLRKVTEVEVNADVTAASISANSSRLALLTEEGPYVFTINGNVALTGSAPRAFVRFDNTFMEGACFVGRGLLVSAETRELWIFNEPATR
jgi:hypothetical protein